LFPFSTVFYLVAREVASQQTIDPEAFLQVYWPSTFYFRNFPRAKYTCVIALALIAIVTNECIDRFDQPHAAIGGLAAMIQQD